MSGDILPFAQNRPASHRGRLAEPSIHADLAVDIRHMGSIVAMRDPGLKLAQGGQVEQGRPEGLELLDVEGFEPLAQGRVGQDDLLEIDLEREAEEVLVEGRRPPPPSGVQIDHHGSQFSTDLYRETRNRRPLQPDNPLTVRQFGGVA
jgi:hypothetical protein